MTDTMIARATAAAVAELRQQERGGAIDWIEADDTESVGINGWVDLLALTRAIVQSIAEPTEAMTEAGARYVRTEGGSIAGIYRAMIEAGLEERARINARPKEMRDEHA